MADPLQELAARALDERDPVAWRALFEAMTPRLYGLAQYLEVPADRREDLVQDTWHRLLKVRWRPDIDFAPYALQTLRNLWTDILRREGRRPAPVPLADGDGHADGRATAEEVLVSLDRAAHIRGCLGRLSGEERAIIGWHYGEERLSHAEIGRRLGLDKAQVRARCYRAAQKLLAWVDAEEEQPPARAPRKRRRQAGVESRGGPGRPPEGTLDHA
jgi:RNA polymerase sigma factor (sigma-70 family)